MTFETLATTAPALTSTPHSLRSASAFGDPSANPFVSLVASMHHDLATDHRREYSGTLLGNALGDDRDAELEGAAIAIHPSGKHPAAHESVNGVMREIQQVGDLG